MAGETGGQARHMADMTLTKFWPIPIFDMEGDV